MHRLDIILTRANEPPAFSIPQERILDPVGPVKIALREKATNEGNPTVTMVIPLAGGMFCVVETTYRLWDMAAQGFAIRKKMWEEKPL